MYREHQVGVNDNAGVRVRVWCSRTPSISSWSARHTCSTYYYFVGHTRIVAAVALVKRRRAPETCGTVYLVGSHLAAADAKHAAAAPRERAAARGILHILTSWSADDDRHHHHGLRRADDPATVANRHE